MARHATRAVRRAPVLIVVVGVLLGGAVIDRAGAAHVNPAVVSESVAPVPVAAPATALSSSWFCAGGSDSTPIVGSGYAVVANDGPRAVTGTVEVVGSNGATNSVPINVAPGASTAVPETVKGGSPWVGAIVDVDAGAVATSQVTDGPQGRTVSPCATSGSARWYLPIGQTRVNATDTILLLNPFSKASIVDLSFSTDQGAETPIDFQGLDVPPRGLLAVPLRDHLRRRASIATTVSARSGNVVAWEAEVVTPPAKGQALVGTPAANSPLADPASPIPGLTVSLGASSAGTSWVWPDGLTGPALDEQYVVYNPGDATAEVRLAFGLPQGTAEPLDITVGPGQLVPVVAEEQPRIPAGTPHTVTLTSLNGVPVVASRVVAAWNAGTPTRTGVGSMLGERMSARSWLIPIAPIYGGHPGVVFVENPGPTPLGAVVHGLAGGDQSVTIKPGQSSAVAVPPGTTSPLVVNAQGPVYVELDSYGTSTTVVGYSLSPAVPLT
jgi:hypothetical protein